MKCKLRKSLFDRWIIINAENEHEAWSGSRWVEHEHGLPVNVQICNFGSREEARDYTREYQLEVIE